MRKICVFTGTRAEYGLLKPLLEILQADSDCSLQLLVSGMHLSPEFGLTYQQIEADSFTIDEKVEMLLSSDSSVGIAKAMGLGLIGYSESLERLRPDLVIVLGDRFEAMAMAQSCMLAGVPVAHLHGGEATYGLIDEPIRHSITKMSHLHFTSTEDYRRRVIQLGETPDRVFNVGAIGLENIRHLDLLDRDSLGRELHCDLSGGYLLVTFHPVTLESSTAEKQFSNLLSAIDNLPTGPAGVIRTIFTKANADTDGRVINRLIDAYTQKSPDRFVAFDSMGQRNYLSAMKHACAVVGNSSSGIIEAPSFRVPTVNIGDRQKGRVQAKSVIDCLPEAVSIEQALHLAVSEEFRDTIKDVVNPYEQPGTARKIVDIIQGSDLEGMIKKEFYDLD
jgi:GDP/UDP-N,N'-diacetylbacillosamine 2-epimerase (hydrolysing)